MPTLGKPFKVSQMGCLQQRPQLLTKSHTKPCITVQRKTMVKILRLVTSNYPFVKLHFNKRSKGSESWRETAQKEDGWHRKVKWSEWEKLKRRKRHKYYYNTQKKSIRRKKKSRGRGRMLKRKRRKRQNLERRQNWKKISWRKITKSKREKINTRK